MFKRIDMLDCVRKQLDARGILSQFDANETAAFARELEWIQAGVIEKKFPALVGAQIVPIVGGQVFPGARSHTYREVTSWGSAEILEEFSLDDFPSSEASGTEVTGRFRSFGSKYSYSFEDLRAKPSLTWDVTSNKSATCRKVMEEKLDKLIFNGYGSIFTGLLSQGTDDTATFAGESGTSLDWSNSATTVDQMANLFRRMVAYGRLSTKDVYKDFDFVVSQKMDIKLNTWIPATTAGGGLTLIDFLLNNVAGVRSITSSPSLDGAGASGKDRVMCYPRDPEVLDAMVPVRYEQFAPQLNGMNFVTPAHGKYGGLRIHQPLAIRRIDVTCN